MRQAGMRGGPFLVPGSRVIGSKPRRRQAAAHGGRQGMAGGSADHSGTTPARPSCDWRETPGEKPLDTDTAMPYSMWHADHVVQRFFDSRRTSMIKTCTKGELHALRCTNSKLSCGC